MKKLVAFVLSVLLIVTVLPIGFVSYALTTESEEITPILLPSYNGVTLTGGEEAVPSEVASISKMTVSSIANEANIPFCNLFEISAIENGWSSLEIKINGSTGRGILYYVDAPVSPGGNLWLGTYLVHDNGKSAYKYQGAKWFTLSENDTAWQSKNTNHYGLDISGFKGYIYIPISTFTAGQVYVEYTDIEGVELWLNTADGAEIPAGKSIKVSAPAIVAGELDPNEYTFIIPSASCVRTEYGSISYFADVNDTSSVTSSGVGDISSSDVNLSTSSQISSDTTDSSTTSSSITSSSSSDSITSADTSSTITSSENNFSSEISSEITSSDDTSSDTSSDTEATLADAFEYEINNGEVTITGYSGEYTEVVIPSEIGGFPVEVIGDNAFAGSDFSAVTIPDSVKIIGNSSFEGCYYIRNLIIPDSVETIGIRAFSRVWCESLVLGNGLKNIGNNAFESCSTLTSVTIPDSVVTIGNEAFRGCYRLSEVRFGNSVESIGNKAFVMCEALTEIVIPDSVKIIGENAFADCINLKNVKLGNGIETIQKFTFYGCSSLESIVIPEGVKYVELNAFDGCSKLKAVVLPESVMSIGRQVFTRCDSLTEIWYEGDFYSKAQIDIFEDNEVLFNVTWHYNVCKNGEHTYSGDCDGRCDVCTKDRTVTAGHTYSSDCDEFCNLCRAVRSSIGNHTYDSDCDSDCNLCGYVRKPSNHVYDSVCDADCNECGAMREPAVHVYSEICDTDCNNCGALRSAEHHIYNNDSDMDCNRCGTYKISVDYKGLEFSRIYQFTMPDELLVNGNVPSTSFTNGYPGTNAGEVKLVDTTIPISKTPLFSITKTTGKPNNTEGKPVSLGTWHPDYKAEVNAGPGAIMQYLKLPANLEKPFVQLTMNFFDKDMLVKNVVPYNAIIYYMDKNSTEWVSTKITAYWFELPKGFDGYILLETKSLKAQNGGDFASDWQLYNYNLNVANLDNMTVVASAPFRADKLGDVDYACYVGVERNVARNIFTGEPLLLRDVCKHQCDDIDSACNICGATCIIDHNYAPATCTAPKTCKLCGTTSGSKLGHTYTNDADTSCNRCGKFAYPGGNTLYKENGVWYHVVNRQKVNDTTMIKFSGSWYYVSGGKVASTYTGLVKYSGSWYYVQNGKMPASYTGLVKHSGSWYYVQNSKMASTYTGLVKHSGSWYYIQNGKMPASYTGLVKHSGSWYYVQNGKMPTSHTGLVKHSGSWYYVQNSKMPASYNNLVKYNGSWYLVQGSKVNFTYKGLYKYNGSWYYIAGGKINFTFSGKVLYSGKYYTVKNGVKV